MGGVLLGIALVLLVFTFYVCYVYVLGVIAPTVPGEQDILTSFGGILGPIIVAGVRAVYLGLMVWIGAIILLRGVNIVTAKSEATVATPVAPAPVSSTPPKTQTTTRSICSGCGNEIQPNIKFCPYCGAKQP